MGLAVADDKVWMLWRSLGHAADDVRGAAAVEIAILAPVLAVVLVCTADLGLGLFRAMQVQNAAQAGAQYAVARGFTASAISAAVTSATSFGAISATPAPVQFCGCPSSAGVTSVTCGSTCTGGSVAGTYVTASATATYTPFLPYPLIPNSFTLVSASTVRLQ